MSRKFSLEATSLSESACRLRSSYSAVVPLVIRSGLSDHQIRSPIGPLAISPTACLHRVRHLGQRHALDPENASDQGNFVGCASHFSWLSSSFCSWSKWEGLGEGFLKGRAPSPPEQVYKSVPIDLLETFPHFKFRHLRIDCEYLLPILTAFLAQYAFLQQEER